MRANTCLRLSALLALTACIFMSTNAQTFEADLVIVNARVRTLDVLIDLAGHTSGHRLSALRFRPAPIQATWLGYPGTTGLGLPSRYLFADKSKMPFMTYSQLQFIKAEAALRGRLAEGKAGRRPVRDCKQLRSVNRHFRIRGLDAQYFGTNHGGRGDRHGWSPRWVRGIRKSLGDAKF